MSRRDFTPTRTAIAAQVASLLFLAGGVLFILFSDVSDRKMLGGTLAYAVNANDVDLGPSGQSDQISRLSDPFILPVP